jgi:tetratricopeptide (TPR) repeat protein
MDVGMDPDTWTRLRPILEGALELEERERDEFVRERCGADEELREKALWYLAAEDDRGILEDDGPLGGRAAAAAGLPVPGAQLGPWRLERELGRGGMGSVWLATRADGIFDKRVAIKRIASHLGGEEILERFHREQRVLAGLDHPGIARLIDAGRDDGGEPFLVMEFVEGQPIDAWCRERDLPVRKRLELFLEVCAAVTHAHRRLVVHRDLKPANILVGEDGVPKLLDFGIARMLEGAPDLTRTGDTRFTPHYASLEQVRGEMVGAQTDVYSLGVVLYELLTGTRPHRFETGSPTEILRVLSEVDPPAPSSVDRSLAGDLDAIVLCALRREPERRYGSVEAFAADVRRHLDGLPVEARPDTLGYRTGKFLRRHGIPLGAAGALVLALAAGLAGTTHQYRRAEEAHAAAERHFGEVRRLATSLIFDVERAMQTRGPTEARERLVDLGLEHLAALAAEAGEDEALRIELAGAYLQMGDVLGARLGPNLGRTAEAVEAYDRAIELVEATSEPGRVRHEGWPLAASAGHKLGGALMVLGRHVDARDAFERALDHVEGAIADPGARDQDLVIAGGLVGSLRLLETRAGGIASAKRLLADELEVTERLLERHPDMAAALHARAVALLAAADLAAAERDAGLRRDSVEAACPLLEEAVRAAPGVVEFRRTLCTAHVQLAEILLQAGEPERAGPPLQEAVAWLERMAADDPSDQQVQRDLAIALVHQGKLRAALDEDAASLEALERALELAADGAERNPDDVDLYSLASGAAVWKARALAELGRPEEARGELARSAELNEQVLSRAPNDPQRRRAVAVNCLELGETALRLGDAGLARGRAAVDRGLRLMERARAEGSESPLDGEIEARLRSTSAELEERSATGSAE